MGENCLNSIDCVGDNSPTPFDYPDSSTLNYNSSNITLDNGTSPVIENGEKFLSMLIISALLGLIILTTIIGNVFVLAAIWMERNLHSVANYLILSLAVADLMVACLVMPLGAVYQVSEKWMFGETMCSMWTVTDVLSCTASILHLVAIAMDRYWAVTNIDYIHQRNPRRICTMIAIIWALSVLISLAQLVWPTDDKPTPEQCGVTQDLGYQIFGTMSSFYVPLAVILFLYYRIFQVARKRIRKRRPAHATALLPRPAAETSLITQASSSNPSPEKTVLINNGGGGGGAGSSSACLTHQLVLPGSPNLSTSTTGITPDNTPIRKHKAPKESGESKRERKAAKTLAIITGAFIMCWLPFFVVALIAPLCSCIDMSSIICAVFLWLGYFNSTLNPVIYTIFSPEFRLAFKKILFGKQHGKSRAVAV